VPPLPLAVAVPFVSPLHVTFVCPEMLAVSAVGCVMVAVAVAWHPFASVTVTV
jgi:hypothetical protein